eukprot:4027881-Pyramimonas_sp.AAC.1
MGAPLEFAVEQLREHAGQARTSTRRNAPTVADGHTQRSAIARFANASRASAATSRNYPTHGGRPLEIERASSHN